MNDMRKWKIFCLHNVGLALSTDKYLRFLWIKQTRLKTFSLYIYIYIYIYMCVCVYTDSFIYIYIYIYIQREKYSKRESERERERDQVVSLSFISTNHYSKADIMLTSKSHQWTDCIINSFSFKYTYIFDWRLSQPGFDPSFCNLACLPTLQSCDIMKQSVFGGQYICSPSHVGLSSLAREVIVAISVEQGSFKWIELSVAVKRIYVNKTNVIHKRLNFLCLRWFPRSWVVESWIGVWVSSVLIPASWI